MKPQIALAKLRELEESLPDFERGYAVPQMKWIANLLAVANIVDSQAATSLRVAAGMLPGALTPSTWVAQILQGLYSLIAKLEHGLSQQQQPGSVFGPGAVYDFFVALRDILGSVRNRVLVVDPYLDANVFDTYVSAVPSSASVDMILGPNAKKAEVKAALEAFRQQTGRQVAVKRNNTIHDRIVIIDDGECYVLGQSLKDAAKKSTTYIAPLPSEIAGLKRDAYADVWLNSNDI
ncbi:hypothetical protein SAMN05216345_102607 [Cupriavidus sp. YR651]|uniref:hypothetical protein n=1 Tax=Cupriavidus sp. YR651 TaxID=1855315 RepID=UPI00088527D2|nr:hypothetical protein [Cupriavidus sp. YR651]SDC52215.1 hypothetical protein SAMN05216345_102607 [Cupriavidus sp. YR651]